MNRKQRRLQEKAAKKNARGKIPSGGSIQQQLQMAAGHFQDNRFTEATRILQRLLKTNPKQVDALHLSGLICLKSDNFTDAILHFQLITRVDAGNIHVWNLLGAAQNRIGDYNSAIASFNKVLTLNPRHIDGHFNIGNAFKALAQYDRAAQHYRQAIQYEPQFNDARFNLGLVLKSAGHFDDAIQCYQKCLEFEPGNPEIITSLGNAEFAAKKFDAAITSHEEALEINPEYAQAWNNLGSVLTHIRHYEKAQDALNQAIKLNPTDTRFMDNLGICQHKSGQLEAAIETFKLALELDPDNAKIHFDLGLSLLHAGRLKDGWPEWEWRWKVGGLGLSETNFSAPRWQGQSDTGKSILVHTEQGFGDTFQFIRLIDQLQNLGFIVIVRCHKAIADLIKTATGVTDVITDQEQIPNVDFHIPLMSLPALLNITEDDIPANIPYLSAPKQLCQSWKNKLSSDKLIKIGFVWSGNPDQENDHNRSMPAHYLSPLLDLDGFSFYSLQVGERGQNLPNELSRKITDLSGELSNFSETAGALSALDLFISVDTGPLHLAGALGIEAWGVLARVPDWRYLMDGERIDWYPSLRFFRQPDHGDWENVICQVKAALQDFPSN